jgi:outer membrane protein assembly factor BamB
MMARKTMARIARRSCLFVCIGATVLLAACASSDRPKPAELPANPGLIGVATAWTARQGPVSFPLQLAVAGETLVTASDDGTVRAIEATNGRERWLGSVGESIAAGVGSDGQFAAVVTRSHQLVVLREGRELWRQRLQTGVWTAPLVAGARVFVLGADRSVLAFDAASGRRLWARPRASEALVLKQAGALLPVGDTLLAGISSRLTAINPTNGSERWMVALASPRGTNEVERLADLVAGVARDGTTVCLRAYQSAVGCVDTARGTLLWTQPANGHQGVSGDGRKVYGVESDDVVVAWDAATGERRWSSERLKYRALSTPRVAGRSVVLGDSFGFVHFLSTEDGAVVDRVATDGSPIVAQPTLVGKTLVVATRQGGLYAYRPR